MKFISVLISAFSALLLCSCGGGSSTSSMQSDLSLTGTVALGAPIANASISVVDSKGSIAGSGTADSTGVYKISISANTVAPYLIKATGIAGDGLVTVYGASSGLGVANISQVTNAIVASLSSIGNPEDAFNNVASLNITTQAINNLDSAYTQAFKNLITITTSFIKSTFTDSIDSALDNIKIDIKSNGDILLATSSSLAADDLASGTTNASTFTKVTVPRGQLPAGNASDQLISTARLSISDLESLRLKLQNCMQIASNLRGNPSTQSSACVDSNFVVTSDPLAINGFKHSGFRWNNIKWNDSNYNPGGLINSYYYGIFGSMLVSSEYDNSKFLPPKIIRPLDAQGNSWIIQFPIRLSSGVLTSLGDTSGNKFFVVKKISSLISSTDNGYRLVGDQRDFMAIITPTIQKVVRQSGVEYQTGLAPVFKKNSSTDPANRKAVLANIRGKGLPPGGIYLAQNDASCGNSASAGLAISFLDNVMYNNSPLNETILASITNNGSSNWTALQTSDICTGVFRMSETGNENSAVALKSWGSDGKSISGGNNIFNYAGVASSGGNWLSDTDFNSILEGEPYSIKIWLSDGSTVQYINRLPADAVSLSVAQTYTNYPIFSDVTEISFKQYSGNSGFPISVMKNNNALTFSVGMFWNGTANSSVNSLSPDNLNTILLCDSACASGAWGPGMAMIKAFARTSNYLSVSTQYWNN